MYPVSDGEVILVAGEALFDLVVDGASSVRAHPGGGPFNVARTAARLQQPTAYLGRLSRDRFGTTLEAMLRDDGVRLDAIVHTDDPTTLAVAEIDPSKSARYRFYDQGTAAPGLTAEAALAALPPAVATRHVGSLALVLEPVAGALEAVVERLAPSALVAVDPNVRPAAIRDEAAYRARLERIFGRAHVVKASEDDLAWLYPERPPPAAARALLDAGPRVVLLTRGADGATVVTASGDEDVPAPPTRVVDTIGAGDAFGAGFLAWWRSRGLAPGDLDDAGAVVDAARFASVVAART